MIQYDIGKTRVKLGERECSAEQFTLAITAYRAALAEYTQERTPLEFSDIQNELSLAQIHLNRIVENNSCE